MDIYCSTGAFVGKVNGRDCRVIPTVAPKIVHSAFELMFEGTWYDDIETVREILPQTLQHGISFPVIHFDKDIGEHISRGDDGSIRKALEKFDINCRLGELVGSKKAVLHLWGGLPSDKNIEINLSLYPRLKHTAAQYGILLTVENVPCNAGDPLDHFEQILRIDPDAAFTVDTRFLAFHDEYDRFYASPFIKNARHVHISDWCAAPMQWDRLRPIPQPGEGHIDFEKFFAFLHAKNYAYSVTLESPAMYPGYIDTDTLNSSLRLLERLANR